MRGSCKVLVVVYGVIGRETYLCGLVSGGGDKVCAVCGELNVIDLKVELVGLDVFQLFARLQSFSQYHGLRFFVTKSAYLGIILADATILMSSNNVLAQITPSSNSSLAIFARNLQTRLIRLLIQVVSLAIAILHIKHHNRAQKAHTLLRHGQKPTSIGAEFDSFHGGGELPYFDAFAGLDVP